MCECGLNHNGSVKLAKRYIDTAKKVGADYVKFQCFWDLKPELKKYELSRENFIELKKYSNTKHITFLCTPHTMSAIDFLNELVPMFKIASPFLTNEKFLLKIRKKRKPLLLSTGSLNHKDGMADDSEIIQALSWLKRRKTTLFHCVSKYPCKDDELWRLAFLFKWTVLSLIMSWISILMAVFFPYLIQIMRYSKKHQIHMKNL